MYESLLPKRARPAYRLSRWAKHLDARAGTLLASGYSTRHVGDHLCAWLDFAQEYEEEGAELPADVHSAEVAAYLDARWPPGQPRRRIIQTALRVLLHGEHVRRLAPMRHPVSALFDDHVPGYLEFARQHRGRRTMRRDESTLRKFFAWLDERGISDLGALEARDLREFVSGLGGLHRTSIARHASDLRVFLRYLDMRGLVASGLAMTVESPRLYRMSTPPEVLDAETVQKLVSGVDRATAIGKRDYAMLLLGARYGLRPCDIRGLRLDDIHWRQQRIVRVQSKTQRLLELPLLREVDEALVDYIRHGRPKCDAREVFVRHVAPIAPLAKRNDLWTVMHRAFKAADVEPPAGRRGFYLLRHSAATRMLGNGAPFDVISDVLGHSSCEPTRVYTQVDLAGLRSVALSAEEVCR